MQEKVIEMSFNYDNFMESQKDLWSHSFSLSRKSYYTYTILPFGILIITFALGNKDFYGPSIIVAIFLLIYMLRKWLLFFKHKKAFFRRNQQYADNFKEIGRCTYIFSDNKIEYIDQEKQFKWNWSLFNPFLIIKDTILLTYKTNNELICMINKKDIDAKDYLELCEILKDKVGAGKSFI